MNKVLTVILMLWLSATGLMNNSCAKKEKSPEEREEIRTKDAKPPPLLIQTRDAFSGKRVNRSIYADNKGKRIYFCCNESKRRFNVDPEKYMTEFWTQGIILEDTPIGK